MTRQAIPSMWEQRIPRSVRLDPGNLLVPAGTVRALMGEGSSRLRYAGFALDPVLRDGDWFVARAIDRAPRPGELALCDVNGWCDVRRLLRRVDEGSWITALDAFPGARETISAGTIIGLVESVGRTGRRPRRWGRAFFLWSPTAAMTSWLRRLRAIPDFDDAAIDTVRAKYAQQVRQYSELLVDEVPAPLERLLIPALPPGGSILVAGSGAGGEAIALARRGFRATGVDFVPAMVESARENAARQGVDAEFVEAEISTLDLGSLRFDAAYITPMVYSFIPTRARRVAALQALRRHLKRGGSLVFSASLLSRPLQWAEVVALWLRRRLRGHEGDEFGDWHTSFLTPAGAIGQSFLHRTWKRQVRGEAKEAGFARVRWAETGYFVASMAGQKGASFRK
jgi:SAM-dependent methyltransferase